MSLYKESFIEQELSLPVDAVLVQKVINLNQSAVGKYLVATKIQYGLKLIDMIAFVGAPNTWTLGMLADPMLTVKQRSGNMVDKPVAIWSNYPRIVSKTTQVDWGVQSTNLYFAAVVLQVDIHMLYADNQNDVWEDERSFRRFITF